MTQNSTTSVQRKILGSRVFIWIGVAILLVITFSLGKAALRKHAIQTQVDSLYDEIHTLENENTEIAGLIGYFKTKNFQEREARETLGLKKKGETVVAIPESDGEDAPVFRETEEEADVSRSNIQKWWDYFFTSEN